MTNPTSRNFPNLFDAFLLVTLTVCIQMPSFAFAQAQANDLQETAEPVDQDVQLKELVASVKASLIVYRDEIRPLQNEMNDVSRAHYGGINAERDFIRKLEAPAKGQLEKVRAEHEELTKRLRMLERLEDTLTAMEPDAKDEAIADATKTINALEAERQNAMRPTMDGMNKLNRKYSADNGQFANRFKVFYRESGSGKFDSFKRKTLNANYANAQVSGHFESGDNKVTVSVILNNPSVKGNPQYSKVGKYPTSYQSPTNLYIKVGNLYVTLHLRGAPMEKETVRELLVNLIDLEKLEKQLGEIAIKAKE